MRCVRVLASRVRALARTCVERITRYLVHQSGLALVPWRRLGSLVLSLVRLVLSLLVRGSLSWVPSPGGFVLVWMRGRLASFAL